jgi:hypothetical protein
MGRVATARSCLRRLNSRSTWLRQRYRSGRSWDPWGGHVSGWPRMGRVFGPMHSPDTVGRGSLLLPWLAQAAEGCRRWASGGLRWSRCGGVAVSRPSGRGPAASPPHAPLDDEPGTTGPGWKVGGAAVQPVTQVVGLAPGQGSLAAGEDTAAVTHGQGGTLGGLDDPGGPADLQGLVGAPPRWPLPVSPAASAVNPSDGQVECVFEFGPQPINPTPEGTQPNLGTSPCSAICVPRTTDPTKPTAVRGSQRSGRRGGLTVDTA